METKKMMPYLNQTDIPIDRDRHEHGRTPTRLEVQQHDLEHKRQGYLQIDKPVGRSPLIPMGNVVTGLRHSLGHLLIGLGSWMTGKSAAGPNPARR